MFQLQDWVALTTAFGEFVFGRLRWIFQVMAHNCLWPFCSPSLLYMVCRRVSCLNHPRFLCFGEYFFNCLFGLEGLTRGQTSVKLVYHMAPKSLTTVSSLIIYLAFGLTSSFTKNKCVGFVSWVYTGAIYFMFFMFMCYSKRMASASFFLVYFSTILQLMQSEFWVEVYYETRRLKLCNFLWFLKYETSDTTNG